MVIWILLGLFTYWTEHGFPFFAFSLTCNNVNTNFVSSLLLYLKKAKYKVAEIDQNIISDATYCAVFVLTPPVAPPVAAVAPPAPGVSAAVVMLPKNQVEHKINY